MPGLRNPSDEKSKGSMTRRRVVQLGAGAAGGSLLIEAGSQSMWPPATAQDDGDEGDSGHGRGRGRGRGGRDDDERENEEVPLAEIPEGAMEVRIVSDDAGGFVPDELTVDLGQSVAFANAHHDEHTATGSGFDTGILPPGSVTTITLETAGRFAYACQIHPEMTGTIVIRDAEGNVPEPSVAAAPAGAIHVSINNLAYDPSQTVAPAGATIVWTNNDASPHTVTSTDGSFDSGIFDPGATFSWTFDRPGTFIYACQLHPQMRGEVIVAGEDTSSTAEGAAERSAASSPPRHVQTGVWLLDLRPADSTLISVHRAIVTFRQDGTLDADVAGDSSATGQSVRLSDGHGEWVERGDVVGVSIVAFILDEQGNVSALNTTDGEMRRDVADSGLAGEFTFSITSVAGDLLGEGMGTISGRKIPLDP